MKLCLTCAPGGHLTQMLELKDIFNKYEHYFFTLKNEITLSLKDKGEKSYFTIDPGRNLFKYIANFIDSIRHYFKERPDVIITTGAGETLPTCYMAKLFRKKIIFIEDLCRVTSPSLFGKFVYPIADLTIVQWEPLLRYYKKAKYGGMLFDFSSEELDENEIKELIFVTVGTHHVGFDRLLTEIDYLIERGIIKEKVIAQIGNSKYEPKNYDWFRFTSPKKFLDIIKISRVIITHGGVGSIMSAFKFNKKTIVVARSKKFGECIDNHQLDIIKMLEKEGRIIPIYNLDNLHYGLKIIPSFEIQSKNIPNNNVIKIIEDYLSTFPN